MAERSGFFDAHLVNGEYDRVYLAEHFAKYFASFISNGIFGGKSNELMVRQKETADMSVRVMSGLGFINGYFYENTDDLSLPIDNADGVLNRIDLIVLRWDKNERVIRLAVEKGSPASSPSSPLLKRNDDYYELELAKVSINAGATRITQADITDTRLDSNVCGFVVGLVKQFDTAEFNAQLNAWFELFKTESIENVNVLLEQAEEIIAEGDLGSVLLDIQNLKNLYIESEDHAGCYYRVVNGETEWLNPPNELGIEYKLAEKMKGRAVYQKTIYAASLPSSGQMNISVGSTFYDIVQLSGRAYFGTQTDHPFPVYKTSNSTVPSAVIVNFQRTGGNISVYVTEDMSSYSAEFTIKYIK